MEGAHQFVALLDDADRRALETIGTPRRAARGQAVLSQGQVADRVLVLREGRVKVVASTPAGVEAVLTFRGPGSLLGEQALLDGAPRAATVVAVEPVEFLAVAAGAFRAYLERRPHVALAMLAMVSVRLRDSDRRLAQFAGADTLGRVSARLLELCEDHGRPGDDGDVTITLPLTQEDLASWAGASLEATAKSLRALRRLGWITTGRRTITVHHVDALRARAA